jgi:hypothetical protein
MKKDRQAQFELVRVIAMFIIVMHHTSIGLQKDPISDFKFNLIFQDVACSLFGAAGVALFVMLSGYFWHNFAPGAEALGSKLKRIYEPVLIYAPLSFILYWMLFGYPDLKSFLKNAYYTFVPFAQGFVWGWWFLGAFTLFLLLQGPLKDLIITKPLRYKFVLLGIFILLTIKQTDYLYPIYFITLGLMGDMIYCLNKKCSTRQLLTLGSLLLIICLIFKYSSVMQEIGALSGASEESGRAEYFPNILLYAGLFILIIKIPVLQMLEKPISKIASLTWGIYLIHGGPLVLHWQRDLYGENLDYFIAKWYFIPYLSGLTILIFTLSAVIENIRIKLFDKMRRCAPEKTTLDSGSNSE